MIILGVMRNDRWNRSQRRYRVPPALLRLGWLRMIELWKQKDLPYKAGLKSVVRASSCKRADDNSDGDAYF
jgi:hypothetical protein